MRRVLTALVLAGGLAAGCRSGARKALPLTARVIERGDFRGVTPGAKRSFNSPRAYLAQGSGLTPTQRNAWVARLARENFKHDLSELLTGGGGQSGLSGVMQLGSAASARAELATEHQLRETQGASGFPVNTIPGAVGFRFNGPTGNGENVLFADGPFLYIVAYGWYGPPNNPRHSALIDAATKLYQRVHGHPPD